MIDIILIIIVALVTWCVATEGVWGAVLSFFSVVFAGLIAMNFFEPLANLLDAQIPAWRGQFDFIALVAVFGLLVWGLRELCAYLSPVSFDVWPALYQGGRWGFAFATGYVTMAILLTALHTSMLPRSFWGFKPERRNFFEISAPDRQWLAFTQHVTEDLFPRSKLIKHATEDSRWEDHAVQIFDGVRIPMATQRKAEYFPTFIIRYASRRGRSRPTGSAVSSGAAPAPSSAPSGSNNVAPSQGF